LQASSISLIIAGFLSPARFLSLPANDYMLYVRLGVEQSVQSDQVCAYNQRISIILCCWASCTLFVGHTQSTCGQRQHIYELSTCFHRNACAVGLVKINSNECVCKWILMMWIHMNSYEFIRIKRHSMNLYAFVCIHMDLCELIWIREVTPQAPQAPQA
jgi:hypothetical protein